MLPVVDAAGQGIILGLDAGELLPLAVKLPLEGRELRLLLGYLAILLGEAFFVVAIEVLQAILEGLQLLLQLRHPHLEAGLALQLVVLDPALPAALIHHLGETGLAAFHFEGLARLDAAQDPVLGARSPVHEDIDVVGNITGFGQG